MFKENQADIPQELDIWVLSHNLTWVSFELCGFHCILFILFCFGFLVLFCFVFWVFCKVVQKLFKRKQLTSKLDVYSYQPHIIMFVCYFPLLF